MKKCLLLLLLVAACDDAPTSEASPVDAMVPVSDSTESPETIDGGSTPPTRVDAGDRPPPAPEACVADAVIQLARDQIAFKSWGRERPAPVQIDFTQTGNACGQLWARSDSPMVGAALMPDGLRVWLIEDALRSGRHQAQVVIGTEGGDPLATLTVALEMWVRAPDEAPHHGLLIGIDGMRSDAFQIAHTPNMDRLGRAGDWTVEATTQLEGTTLSGPGWGSILSGVDVDKHGVTDNGDVSLDANYPSFLTRLRVESGVRTAGALQWAPLLAMVGPEALDEGLTGDHTTVTAEMGRMLGEDYAAFFIHFDDVDHAGHATGFAIDNPEYIESIERVDEAIGTLVAAILDRATVADEEWLLVVTTDHGGRGTGHGPRDEENRRIPFIVSGPTVMPGTMGGVSHIDAAPTILAHLGYDLDPNLGLDGRPRGVPGEFACADSIDNDGDGGIDCDDSDCYRTAVCGAGQPESACQNSRDDDHDGLVDCADPDCVETPACNVECVSLDLGGAVGRGVFRGNIAGEGAVLASSCGGDQGPEVVLLWQAPADDVYLFDTFDSDFDTILTLRDGDCVGPELACNDHAFGSVRGDTPLPAQSAIRVALDAGHALSMVLDSGPLGGGAAVLDITPMGAQCPDEDLGGIVGAEAARGTNTDGQTRYLGDCAGTARDAVYLWTAPADGQFVFDTFGSNFDTVLFIMEGACGETQLGCNDDARELQSSLVLDAEAGGIYTIVVAGFRGRNGTYQLNITGP